MTDYKAIFGLERAYITIEISADWEEDAKYAAEELAAKIGMDFLYMNEKGKND